ncbi:MAG: Hsp20/alpha crystallin family protein, partial [Fimbriimonas ginsengisoli]|nr:Hsp20/alpha crystallin family protein [Fimbriimonas ginsengisoli]
MDLEDRLLVRAEIAGMRGEEIGLLYNVERHSLLIRGVRSEDLSDAGHCQFHQMEIPFGEFEREVKLPDVVIQPEGIRARYA